MRPGWKERDPYRGPDEDYASYELRVTDDHWVTVHSGPKIHIVSGPIGLDLSGGSVYESVEDAMRDAELAYAESLSNSLASAHRRAADMRQALDQLAALGLDVPSQPTKETYTREQLLSDEVIETLAREAESRWAYSPGDPAHARVRSSIRREIEAACDAIDKGKGGEDG